MVPIVLRYCSRPSSSMYGMHMACILNSVQHLQESLCGEMLSYLVGPNVVSVIRADRWLMVDDAGDFKIYRS